MKNFHQSVTFKPAYDRRNSDPKKNYGIHGVEIRFVLKGDKGAVQFLLYTNWHLPHVQEELDTKIDNKYPHFSCHPLPADLGYHSPTPRYEEQVKMDNCDLLEQGYCYYDGSGLNAESVYQQLLTEGDTGVWTKLEEFYKEIFEEKENTNECR